MKKSIIILSISLLSSFPIFAKQATPLRSVKLDNSILSMVDGKQLGINGENVALTKKYQAQILEILLGVKTKNGRQGTYEFEGQKYGAQRLRFLENGLENNATPDQKKELHQALKKMRNDFEQISETFKDMARSSKPIMAALIEESCKKRGRDDALILIWAKSKEDEYKLFDRHVKTVQSFEIFMTDLYNFLGDLVASCPIAQQQFKDRLAKFSKIKRLLSVLSLTPQQQQLFFKFIQSKLNSIDVNSINEAKVRELYNASRK